MDKRPNLLKPAYNIIIPQGGLKIDYFIIILASLVIAGVLWTISYYGNPLTDESFPIAIAFRFILGQKPFVDDLSPYISLGLLLQPLVKWSILLHHGTDQLILFLRHLYVALVITSGIYAYFCTKKYLPRFPAFFVAAMLAIYHPFGINNFHYDTLALLFWSLLIFQLFNFTQRKSSYFEYFIFACYAVILCFSYPTFSFLLLPLLAIYFFYLQQPKIFLLVNTAVLILSVFLISVVLQHLKVEFFEIKAWLSICKSYHHAIGRVGDWQKLSLDLVQLSSIHARYLMCIFFLVPLMYLLRTTKWIFLILFGAILVLPLCGYNISSASFIDVFYFFNCFGFLGAMLFFVFLRYESLYKKLFYFIWIPSLVAGLLTTATSSNTNGMNFIIGFFPADILGFLFAYHVFQMYCKRSGIGEWQTYVGSRLIFIYALLITIFFQINYLYGAGYGKEVYVTAKKYAETGPFNGLHLNPTWTTLLNSIIQSLKQIDRNSNNFIYFGSLSGGYLLVKQLKPGDYMLYSAYDDVKWGDKKMCVPNYSLILTDPFGVPREKIKNHIVKNHYIKFLTTEYYNIYYTTATNP